MGVVGEASASAYSEVVEPVSSQLGSDRLELWAALGVHAGQRDGHSHEERREIAESGGTD